MDRTSDAVQEAVGSLYGLRLAGSQLARLAPLLTAIDGRPERVSAVWFRAFRVELEHLAPGVIGADTGHASELFARRVVAEAFARFDPGYVLFVDAIAAAGARTVATNSAGVALKAIGRRLVSVTASDTDAFGFALFELPALLLAHDLVEPRPARSYLERVHRCTRAVVDDAFPWLTTEANIGYIQGSLPDGPARRTLRRSGAAALARAFQATYDSVTDGRSASPARSTATTTTAGIDSPVSTVSSPSS